MAKPTDVTSTFSREIDLVKQVFDQIQTTIVSFNDPRGKSFVRRAPRYETFKAEGTACERRSRSGGYHPAWTARVLARGRNRIQWSPRICVRCRDRARFGELWRAAAETACTLGMRTPEGALRAFRPSCLDQFPRTMFSGGKRVLRGGCRCPASADRAIHARVSTGICQHERPLLLYAFHALENPVDQERCMDGGAAYGDDEF